MIGHSKTLIGNIFYDKKKLMLNITARNTNSVCFTIIQQIFLLEYYM